VGDGVRRGRALAGCCEGEEGDGDLGELVERLLGSDSHGRISNVERKEETYC
jgi:hypothetical protein